MITYTYKKKYYIISLISVISLLITCIINYYGNPWVGWADRDIYLGIKFFDYIPTFGSDLKFGGYTIGGAYYLINFMLISLLQNIEYFYILHVFICVLFSIIFGVFAFKNLVKTNANNTEWFSIILFLFFLFSNPSISNVLLWNWNPLHALTFSLIGLFLFSWWLNRQSILIIFSSGIFITIAAQAHMAHWILFVGVLLSIMLFSPKRKVVGGAVFVIGGFLCFAPWLVLEGLAGWPFVDATFAERSIFKLAQDREAAMGPVNLIRHVRDYAWAVLHFGFGGGGGDIFAIVWPNVSDRLRYFILFASSIGTLSVCIAVYQVGRRLVKRSGISKDDIARNPLYLSCITIILVFILGTVSSGSYNGYRYVAPIVVPAAFIATISFLTIFNAIGRLNIHFGVKTGLRSALGGFMVVSAWAMLTLFATNDVWSIEQRDKHQTLVNLQRTLIADAHQRSIHSERVITGVAIFKLLGSSKEGFTISPSQMSQASHAAITGEYPIGLAGGTCIAAFSKALNSDIHSQTFQAHALSTLHATIAKSFNAIREDGDALIVEYEPLTEICMDTTMPQFFWLSGDIEALRAQPSMAPYSARKITEYDNSPDLDFLGRYLLRLGDEFPIPAVLEIQKIDTKHYVATFRSRTMMTSFQTPPESGQVVICNSDGHKEYLTFLGLLDPIYQVAAPRYSSVPFNDQGGKIVGIELELGKVLAAKSIVKGPGWSLPLRKVNIWGDPKVCEP